MKKANPEIAEMWNKISDSDWYNSYRTEQAIQAIIENPSAAFHPAVFKLLSECMGDFKNKAVLVPSSGDNHAVFAFHLLGARVTSADISHRQIDNAKAIAQKHGWDIEFLVDNTMTLAACREGYDLVYTSNGVFVWMDDLPSMFANVSRVLKPNGAYIFYDIHPFMRPFADGDPANQTSLAIEKPYDSTHVGNNRHWRVQDLLNAMTASGLALKRLEELYPEFGTFWFESTGGRKDLSEQQLRDLYDWKTNPLAALPAWLAGRLTKIPE